MATNSKKIKTALNKVFPRIKFSVTYKRVYGYTVKWQNAIYDGATVKNVKEIASAWDTSERQEISYGEYNYFGDSISYNHEITDQEWKQYVIDYVLKTSCVGVYYDEDYDCFKKEDGQRAYHENKDYSNFLHNGIMSNLDDQEVIYKRDRYYKDVDQLKINKVLEQEQEYLSGFPVAESYQEYVGKETESIKVIGVRNILNRPEYRIYNREIIYDTSTEEIIKLKPFCAFQINVEFTILDKKDNQERTVSFDDILDIFDPVKPIAIADANIRFKNKYAWNYKITNFESFKAEILDHDFLEDCLIEEIIKLTPEHYDRFTNQLDYSYDWLADKGGTGNDIDLTNEQYYDLSESEQELFDKNSYSICILLFAENKKAILIDTQGYNYARYVAEVDIEIAKQSINILEKKYKSEEVNSASKIIPFKAASEKIEIERKSTIQKVDYLVEYKKWVNLAIEKDRVCEIISYDDWIKQNSQLLLQKLYKKFIHDCLEYNQIDKIISFEKWQIMSIEKPT